MDHATSWVVGVLGAVTQLILGVAILVRVLRAESKIDRSQQLLDGRIDLLLQEQEKRLAAEYRLQMIELRKHYEAEIPPTVRPPGIIRPEKPSDDEL